jgi:NADH-quinone oxidoreductase subunit N
MACVGCFYYIRLIKVMYFDKNLGAELINCATKPINALLSFHGLLVIAIGIMPYLLIKYCQVY